MVQCSASSTTDHPVATSPGLPQGQPGSCGAALGRNFLGAAPPWVRDEEWVALSQRLDSLLFVPSILELCAGASTASLALKLLLGQDKVRLAGLWDTDVELLGIHEVVHGSGEAAGKVHLGKKEGDILKADLASFPDANILVAGPPCPPFSSCGKRLALDDPSGASF